MREIVMWKNLFAAVFLIALLAWAWLEFFVPAAGEGLKDILFWTGMLAVLLTLTEVRRARP
jgi:hypothetical protein